MWVSNDRRADLLFPTTSAIHGDDSTRDQDGTVNGPENQGHQCCGNSIPDWNNTDNRHNYYAASLYPHHQYQPHQEMEDFGLHDDNTTILHPRHHHRHRPLPPHQDHLVHESSQLHQRHQHPHHHHHQQQIQTHRHLSSKAISKRPPNFRLSNSVWTTCITVLLSLIFLSSHLGNGSGVAALSCATCDLELCPETSGCSGGLVMDICGCCRVCAKTEDQSCGGPFGIRGKCDRNLQCFIRPEVGQRITGSEEGVCKEVRESRCEGVNCPPAFEQLLCPRDSTLVTFASDFPMLDNTVPRTVPPDVTLLRKGGNTPRNAAAPHHSISTRDTSNNNISSDPTIQMDNNIKRNIKSNINRNSNNNVSSSELQPPPPPPPPVLPTQQSHSSMFMGEDHGAETVPERISYCVCNTSRCNTPMCAPGFTPSITQNATGFPGSCCDIFTCNKTKGCDPVICPPLDETPCPDDSIQLPNTWTGDNCCELQSGCSCPSTDRCEPVRCPSGFQVQIIARGTGLPGSCCDKFRCVNESGMTCRYDGREVKNGEKWNVDKCRSCVCKDGLNRCRDKTCSKMTCLWSHIPDGECCPICKGCISDSGSFYNNSEVWKENDCTTCKCTEGKVSCQAESCAVYCAHPVRVPGQCCPECPEEEGTTVSTALTPIACPSLGACNLECPAGLELSPHGCFVCKCAKETCVLDCPYGLKTDFEGNTLCECQSPEMVCPVFEEDKCDKRCEYGYRRNTNGCVKCKCNRCPRINCTKRCLHGLYMNDEGCHVCKCKEERVPELIGPPKVESSTAMADDLSCMSHYGVYHENGESWNDGCRVCYCHNGLEMCSLIACRAPHCSNPVFKLGDCCPSCPGLTIPSPNGDKLLCQSTNGDYYVEGQTWRMDPCTRCVCHGGSILCETLSCPPVLCHRPIIPENQCCPICKGEDFSLLPPSPQHRRCKSATGMLYKHREVWRSTPCQTCVCQDGQFHCYNQMCAPLKCNKTLLRKDQCCPTCAEPETKKSKICSYNNEFYDAEEKWEGDNCTQCMCSNGNVHCFPLTCPTLKCSVMVTKRGQCCPTCFDMPSSEKESREYHRNTTASPTKQDSEDQSYIGMIILGVILFLFALAIVYLVYRLYLKRQKQKHAFRDACSASNDKLQSQTFLPPSESNDNDNKQHDLKKLYHSGLADKRTEDRAFNTYTHMNFCDQNKNSPPI